MARTPSNPVCLWETNSFHPTNFRSAVPGFRGVRGRTMEMTESVAERLDRDGLRMRELPEICRLKRQSAGGLGWSPLLRAKFGYYTPDEWYEAMLFRLINEQTLWLDVGCGRQVLPFNEAAAKLLADRCRLLAGLDPSDNIDENLVVQERAKCRLEEYDPSRTFDVISLRMVAEHIADPQAAAIALSRLAAPGGRVVIYTVARWSPATIISAITPIAAHHFVKDVLWKAERRDTFPPFYLMNSRKRLRVLFEENGFEEETFWYLDDCRSFGRWKFMLAGELLLWKALRAVHLPYPEACLLGVYRKEVR